VPSNLRSKVQQFRANGVGSRLTIGLVGAMGCLCIVPSTASIVNQVLTKFLSRLPPTRSDIQPPDRPTAERMAEALKTLSELMGDSNIATRDPMCSLSFSCLSPEVINSQKDAVDFYGKDEWKALSPLGPDGRPIRKCALEVLTLSPSYV